MIVTKKASLSFLFLIVLGTIVPGLLSVCLPASTSSSLLAHDTTRDLRIGEFYKGPIRVRSPLLGVSFEVPSHWRVRVVPGVGVIHMDSGTRAGLGVIHLLPDITEEAVLARLREPQVFDEAYVLDPNAPLTRDGSRYYASYQQGDQIGQAVAVIGPGSQAAIFLLAGPASESDIYRQLVRTIAHTTRFVTQEQARSLQAWYRQFSGIQLTSSSQNLSDWVHEWHFCGDGRFVHHYHLRIPENQEHEHREPTGHHESGPWRIEIISEDVQLMITPDHALPRIFSVKAMGPHITLNGEIFDATPSRICF